MLNPQHRNFKAFSEAVLISLAFFQAGRFLWIPLGLNWRLALHVQIRLEFDLRWLSIPRHTSHPRPQECDPVPLKSPKCAARCRTSATTSSRSRSSECRRQGWAMWRALGAPKDVSTKATHQGDGNGREKVLFGWDGCFSGQGSIHQWIGGWVAWDRLPGIDSMLDELQRCGDPQVVPRVDPRWWAKNVGDATFDGHLTPCVGFRILRQPHMTRLTVDSWGPDPSARSPSPGDHGENLVRRVAALGSSCSM